MVILSAPPPCSLFTSAAAGAARASSPACSSWRAASIFSVKVSSSVEFCPSAKSVRGMAEIFGGDKTKGSATAAADALAASGSSSSCSVSELSLSLNFVDFRTEEDLLSGIRKAAESGRLPLNVTQGMEELYQNYRNAVYQSGDPKAREIVLSNMALAFDRIFMDVKDPFDFSSYHKAIREPFDYYMFGQNYIRPLIDFRNSYVGNISLFNEIGDKLLQGDNIVLMSNHQTEADPAVIALLLESTNPNLAENMIYVAGDRVITDPLCKPFSMGRNLLCVYSKKHMNDDPELVEMKRRANTKSLKDMALLLRYTGLFVKKQLSELCEVPNSFKSCL